MAATLELIASDGPAAITHQRIAQLARVSRSTLYRYWPQPEDLLFEALAQIVTRFDFNGPGRLRDELIAELSSRRREINQPVVGTAMAAVLSRASHDPGAAELRDRLHRTLATGLRQSIRRGVERGELRSGLDADTLVAKVFGALAWRSFVETRPVTVAFIESTVIDALAGWELP
ncbi:MAG: TetR/AcrR family transcriptional regulator [Solirubrobacteraceae bacterium]